MSSIIKYVSEFSSSVQRLFYRETEESKRADGSEKSLENDIATNDIETEFNSCDWPGSENMLDSCPSEYFESETESDRLNEVEDVASEATSQKSESSSFDWDDYEKVFSPPKNFCSESKIESDRPSEVASDTSSDIEDTIPNDKLGRKQIYDKEIDHRRALKSTHERDRRSSYVEKNSKADKKAELQEWIEYSKNKFLAERF